MNQSPLKIKKTLKTIQIQQAPNHSLGTEAMARGPPDMKCCKKKFPIKIYFFKFLFYFFPKTFHVMARGLPDMKCFKKNFPKRKNK
jgi:hypothetical protein